MRFVGITKIYRETALIKNHFYQKTNEQYILKMHLIRDFVSDQ